MEWNIWVNVCQLISKIILNILYLNISCRPYFLICLNQLLFYFNCIFIFVQVLFQWRLRGELQSPDRSMAIKNWLIRLNKCLWFLTSQDLIVPTSIVGDNAGRGTISCDGNITLFVTESVLIVAILLPPEYTVFALRQRPTARRDDESARRPDDWIPRRNILEHFYIFFNPEEYRYYI